MSCKYKELIAERDAISQEIVKANDLLHMHLTKRRKIEIELETTREDMLKQQQDILLKNEQEIEKQSKTLNDIANLRTLLVPHVQEMKKILTTMTGVSSASSAGSGSGSG